MQMCRLSTRNWLAALLRIYKRKQNIMVIIHFRYNYFVHWCVVAGNQRPATNTTTRKLPKLLCMSWTLNESLQPVKYLAVLEVQIGKADEAFKHFMPGRNCHPSFQSGMESRNWSCWMWDLNGRVFFCCCFFSGQICWNRLGEKSAGFFTAHWHTVLTMIMGSRISKEGKCNWLGSLIMIRRRW